MDSEKALSIVEQLLQKQLTQIEQRVLILSWEGQSYKEIEENTGYVIGYLRDIGSNLWKELSEILQKRVTKKNLPLVLEQLENEDSVLPIARRIDYPTKQLNAATIPSEKELIGFPSAPMPANSRLYVKRPP